ncbi:MAG: DUF998 domain-containing protein [Gemmatimonadales bacterium]|nr:MAG: DUF998 domain-containing protein [Gemmatimonadales bacterium]
MVGDMRRAPPFRKLLLAGAIAGPLYLTVGVLQMLLREGFDPRLHALSLLANGELGWIQVGNFIVAGLLVALAAWGLRGAMRGERGGTWGPVLLALYALGLLGAGVFVADPGAGFPPGTPVSTGMTRPGLLHFVFGAVGFYSLVGACFVFAVRFREKGRTGWALYSVVTGAGFLLSFMAIASGRISPLVMLTFYGAVAWSWIWLSAFLVHEAGRAEAG